MNLITLTLNPGAVKLKVLPVEMLLVRGTTVFGCAGVLLALCEPVNCCKDPDEATLLNGSWNVRSAAAATVFDT